MQHHLEPVSWSENGACDESDFILIGKRNAEFTGDSDLFKQSLKDIEKNCGSNLNYFL